MRAVAQSRPSSPSAALAVLAGAVWLVLDGAGRRLVSPRRGVAAGRDNPAAGRAGDASPRAGNCAEARAGRQAVRPRRGSGSGRSSSGNISPKSVAASGAGYVTAQNMMYRHSVTVYDARTPEAREDDPRRCSALAARVSGVPRRLARRSGGGGVLFGRALRVRLQLLDVRRRLRPRGQRHVLAELGLRPELRLPHRHGRAPHRPRIPGRVGAEGRRRHARRPLRPRLQLVLVRPERRLDAAPTRGEADPHRGVSARDRGRAERPRSVRRRHGRQRPRARRPPALDHLEGRSRGRAARRRVPPVWPLHLRLAERRGPGREARPEGESRPREGLHRQRALAAWRSPPTGARSTS